jgi:putative transposase
MFEQHFGCNRFVYNWALELKVKNYQQHHKKISAFDLINMLPCLKKEHPWLSDVYSQSLQQSIRHLDQAFTSFFRDKKGFPKFKSKHSSKQSFSIPQNISVDFKHSRIIVPKFGFIEAVFHREFEGDVRTCTFSRTPTGKYFVSILVEDHKEFPKKARIKASTAVGIDLGLKDFVTLSNGEKIQNPRFGNKDQTILTRHQRVMSRRTKNGSRWKRAKLAVAKIYERTTNRRRDFLHKLSSKLIGENQTVCLEDLNVKGMLRNHKLARSISDASWSEFVGMLKYKSEWRGKNLLFIGRFDPSSKMCSKCGWIKRDLQLKDRSWKCEAFFLARCWLGAPPPPPHDRDVNAAKNILSMAFQKQNLLFKKDVVKTPWDTREELGELLDSSTRAKNQEATPL